MFANTFEKRLDPCLETKKDAERLKHDFGQLNFDVYEFENYSKLQTMTILEEVSKKDHSQKKYFVCCFLTHGSRETLAASDKNMDISDIFSHFTRSSCRTLSGKPKLFIIQACRGPKYEDENSVNCADYFPVEGNQDYLDFLIVNSTYYDTKSFKSSNEEHAIYHGSFFIDEFCRSLEQFCHRLEFLQILTIVNYCVSYLFLSKSKHEERNEKKQMPCFVSRLRTQINFNKAISPFVSRETRYFDKRRKEFRLGLESTENPLSDIKHYQLPNPEKIMFLSIANMEMNGKKKKVPIKNEHLLSAAESLRNYFAERKYSCEAYEMEFKKSKVMEFLSKNIDLNSSKIDCLVCFFAGSSRNGRLLDGKGLKISKEEVYKHVSLSEKPKIFIYLICELPYQEFDSTDGGSNGTIVRKNFVPFHADILEICITITEWKQADEVIKTFCQILLDNPQEDFVNLLTKINKEFVDKHSFFMISEKEPSDKCTNGTFVVASTLTKSLFLP